ncbi:hypothetical protein TorRG33x02_099000 [Trema orientale]|uniref:Uncharacterized protein n=1 Tax=Trema orientale TaxID=63057 RepID=A0A2P5F9H6_TREOI|nr:hypothetical protein TorRG33x02_099000 [Trema orientale]
MEPAAEGHQLRVEALGIEGCCSRKWRLISDDQIDEKGGEKRSKRHTSGIKRQPQTNTEVFADGKTKLQIPQGQD